jgi:hypothetical protein
VNVAAHRAYQEFLAGKTSDLLIPCGKAFQLDVGSNADTFIQSVYFEVAQTLVVHTEQLAKLGRKLPESHAVSKWLNSPQLSSWQGGVQVLVAGVSAGRAAETNTGAGFSLSGFRQLVEQWLTNAFPGGKGGGVVCVLDNLELTETSSRAKQLLENLRDRALTISGLRWVLCGSSGIVRSVVSTPRLEGVLHSPIDVGGLPDKYAPDVLTSRVQVFSVGNNAYLPLLNVDFERLYQCLRGNLRNALSKSDDYCMWIAENGDIPQSDEDKKRKFAEWLDSECTAAGIAAAKGLGNRAWQTFDKAVAVGGSFSPSDVSDFGFESVQALRPSVRDLEEVGLLMSTQDDTDKRRKTVQVTAKGWLVSMWRAGKLQG